MTTDEPVFGNDSLIQSLRTSLQNREHSIKAFPGLLRRTIETEAWRSFKTPLGDPVEHQRFSGFLTADPFDGLGITVEYARRIVGEDKGALDLLDQALQGKHGGDRKSDQIKVDNIHVDRPTGTSESAALRRLRKDRPDLHARVLDNELSAHAAAVLAGFRPKTFTVRADNPDSIVATLRRQLPPEVLTKVVHLLEGW